MVKLIVKTAGIFFLMLCTQVFGYKVLQTTGAGPLDMQFLVDKTKYPFVAANADGVHAQPAGWSSLGNPSSIITKEQFMNIFTNKKVFVTNVYNGQTNLMKRGPFVIPTNASYLAAMIYSEAPALRGIDLIAIKAKQNPALPMLIVNDVRNFSAATIEDLKVFDGMNYEFAFHEIENTAKLDNLITAIKYCVDNNKIIGILGAAASDMSYYVPRYKAAFYYIKERLEARYLNSDLLIFMPTTYGDSQANRFTPETEGANTFTELVKWLIEQKSTTFLQPKIKSTSFSNGDMFSNGASLVANFTVTHSVAISNMKLYFDGVLVGEDRLAPFNFSGGILNAISPGWHVLKQVATDVNGRKGEMTQIIRVLNSPPKIPAIIEAGEYKEISGNVATQGTNIIPNCRENDVITYLLDVQKTGKYNIKFGVFIQRPKNFGGTIILSDETRELGRVTTLLNDPALPKPIGFVEEPDNISIPNIQLTKGLQTIIITFDRVGAIKPQFDLKTIDFQYKLATPLEFDKADELNGVFIYPNPSTDGVFNLSQEVNWKVTSVLGEELMNGSGDIINISEQPKGVYLIKINDRIEKIVLE